MSSQAAVFEDIARQLIEIPTAPFREEWVCVKLDEILAGIPGVEYEIDRFGNRIARLRKGNPESLPVTFVAHLDHPGFLFHDSPIPKEGSKTVYEIIFEGRVQDDFFPGSKIRLYRSPEDPGTVATILKAATEGAETGYRVVEIETEEDVSDAVLGMWDVPPFEVRDGMIHARLCDDLIGAAAILHAMKALAEEPDVHITAIFSRAEEAGFCGVLCLLEDPLSDLLSPDTIFCSVENSGEIDGIASVGDGAIIRIGDRATTFDGPLTDELYRLARRDGLKARRVLMDRGTCEATAFARSGYRAGGLCVPLRNYHNMDMATRKIAPEAISINDALELSRLIALISSAPPACVDTRTAIKMNYSMYLEKGHRMLPVSGNGTAVPR